MGDDGVAKIYELYFGAYAKDEFDAALERRQQNIKEFTEIKQMEYNAITHHADPVYASNKNILRLRRIRFRIICSRILRESFALHD